MKFEAFAIKVGIFIAGLMCGYAWHWAAAS